VRGRTIHIKRRNKIVASQELSFIFASKIALYYGNYFVGIIKIKFKWRILQKNKTATWIPEKRAMKQ